MISRFASPSAFRQSLEARLMNFYGPARIQRGRKRVAVERLIVRLQQQRPSGFLLKGGFVLELRLAGAARATRDLDVSADPEMPANADSVADEIEQACGIDARDGFEFRTRGIAEELAPSGNAKTFRYSVEASVAGRTFEIIPVDVRSGDFYPPGFNSLSGSSLLDSLGLDPPRIRVVTLEYHFAEKIHALTRARETGNTRVRDLVDLCLLIDLGVPSSAATVCALRAVFNSRGTDPIPAKIPPVPASWRDSYRQMAEPLPVPKTAAEALARVNNFYFRLGF